MRRKAHGQLRRSQVILTYGPGALIDLPKDSAILGGLRTWGPTSELEPVVEPRLERKLQMMTDVDDPRMFAPPIESDDWSDHRRRGISAYRFPEWYVVQEPPPEGDRSARSRRLVHRKLLDHGRFENLRVVATRFVRACPRGHVDDIQWHRFLHGPDSTCRLQLWLDETGTTGDLADLSIRCECKEVAPRSLYEASESEALGTCSGAMPWLGRGASEECSLPSRLLIRTAANAYFPQVVSVLSLPDQGAKARAVFTELWDDLQIVEDAGDLATVKRKPRVAEKLAPYGDREVLQIISEMKAGVVEERPVKQVELDALLTALEGFGDDVPIDLNFHARRLPESVWHKSDRFAGVQSVVQLHRLREVLALVGFTRFEAVTPDINGEYDTDVVRAELDEEPTWFPAVENRGEGVFLHLRAEMIAAWLARPVVKARVDDLAAGYKRWQDDGRGRGKRSFPGGPYVLLHTLSHLLIQSLAMRCGYPASSIRERVYSDPDGERYGVLLYTGTPDAEGTLGGLVQQGRHIEDHLANALRMAALCSNDPVCAQHSPASSLEKRFLHGAACHGCTLVAETSCEMRNDYLDRALVVPVLGEPDAAFFRLVE